MRDKLLAGLHQPVMTRSQPIEEKPALRVTESELLKDVFLKFHVKYYVENPRGDTKVDMNT